MKCKGITKKGKACRLKGPYCHHHETPGLECSVCLESISPMYSLSVRCGHVFHIKCINKWKLHGGNSCPMCSTSFIAPPVIPIHSWYTLEYLIPRVRSLWRIHR